MKRLFSILLFASLLFGVPVLSQIRQPEPLNLPVYEITHARLDSLLSKYLQEATEYTLTPQKEPFFMALEDWVFPEDGICTFIFDAGSDDMFFKDRQPVGIVEHDGYDVLLYVWDGIPGIPGLVRQTDATKTTDIYYRGKAIFEKRESYDDPMYYWRGTVMKDGSVMIMEKYLQTKRIFEESW